MARIRKAQRKKDDARCIRWRVGKYIRLSREDGNEVSESVVNQDKILNDELPQFFETDCYEVTDTYIDDGTSGTTDLERRDFQRMVQDMKSGRINCIIVKNLSRAFRNSANQGHFLEEFIPLYHTRFISLYQPRIDTYLDPEVVHSLEVSITGFMNEQYAYKTSADVRRTFANKRKSGAFIGAFAPYGYSKDPQNKNALIIDEAAAQVVRDMFTWFVDRGMSKAGITKRLNELGIPNPTAYKRSKGFRYENPHAAQNDGMWNPTTVSRILQDPLYIGTMRQGRQKVISYKLHKRTAVPENDWYVVEHAIPPIIGQDTFQAAQELHKRDTRAAPGQREVYLFSGLIRCADCKKGMTRRTSKGYVYYACRTYQEKNRQRCGRHSIRADVLEQVILAALQKQIELVDSLADVIDEIERAPAMCAQSVRLNTLLSQQTKQLQRVESRLDGLYLDWKDGEITHDQYRRMKAKLEEQSNQLRITIGQIKGEREVLEQGCCREEPYLEDFLRHRTIRSLSRGLLIQLVRAVYVHRDGEIEIEFCFGDQYRRIVELVANSKKGLYEIGGKIVS